MTAGASTSSSSAEVDNPEHSVGAAVRLSDVLTTEEIKPFVQRSDVRAWGVVVYDFALIAGAFAVAGLWPNPITVIAAILILGGRQLALAVIYHDASQGVLFRTRRLNDLLGHWVAAGLLNTSMYAYRAYHLKHHKFAGTPEDPDMPLANAYPTSSAALKRKFQRDATGQTGWKAVSSQLKRLRPRRNVSFLLSHGVMLGLLALAGIAWTYVLWWVAHITWFHVILRLRFISEHGVAIDRLSSDARENTSTTVISWWEGLLIGPNNVNYHLEHHLSAAVPCYHLPALHRLLRDRGFFDDFDCLSHGYVDVLRKAARKPEAQPQAA